MSALRPATTVQVVTTLGFGSNVGLTCGGEDAVDDQVVKVGQSVGDGPLSGAGVGLRRGPEPV